MNKKSNVVYRCQCALINAHRFHYVPKKTDFHRWINTTIQYVLRSHPSLMSLISSNKAHKARVATICVLNVCVSLINESESAHLNLTYRHKKGPTNVLSFPYDHSLGDLAFCVPLIKQEARQQKKTVRAHFAHLTLHGTLHLLGYDHQEEEDTRQMQSLETILLETLLFNNPYKDTCLE